MSEEQNQERAIIADEQDVEYEIGHLDETQGKEAEEFALKVIKAAASLKMVKIDRGKFLRTELQKHYPEADLNLAVSETPAEAGVPAEVLDTIATEAINARHFRLLQEYQAAWRWRVGFPQIWPNISPML